MILAPLCPSSEAWRGCGLCQPATFCEQHGHIDPFPGLQHAGVRAEILLEAPGLVSTPQCLPCPLRTQCLLGNGRQAAQCPLLRLNPMGLDNVAGLVCYTKVSGQRVARVATSVQSPACLIGISGCRTPSITPSSTSQMRRSASRQWTASRVSGPEACSALRDLPLRDNPGVLGRGVEWGRTAVRGSWELTLGSGL